MPPCSRYKAFAGRSTQSSALIWTLCMCCYAVLGKIKLHLSGELGTAHALVLFLFGYLIAGEVKESVSV